MYITGTITYLMYPIQSRCFMEFPVNRPVLQRHHPKILKVFTSIWIISERAAKAHVHLEHSQNLPAFSERPQRLRWNAWTKCACHGERCLIKAAQTARTERHGLNQRIRHNLTFLTAIPTSIKTFKKKGQSMSKYVKVCQSHHIQHFIICPTLFLFFFFKNGKHTDRVFTEASCCCRCHKSGSTPPGPAVAFGRWRHCPGRPSGCPASPEGFRNSRNPIEKTEHI